MHIFIHSNHMIRHSIFLKMQRFYDLDFVKQPVVSFKLSDHFFLKFFPVLSSLSYVVPSTHR